jgi:hypothetical protein
LPIRIASTRSSAMASPLARPRAAVARLHSQNAETALAVQLALFWLQTLPASPLALALAVATLDSSASTALALALAILLAVNFTLQDARPPDRRFSALTALAAPTAALPLRLVLCRSAPLKAAQAVFAAPICSAPLRWLSVKLCTIARCGSRFDAPTALASAILLTWAVAPSSLTLVSPRSYVTVIGHSYALISPALLRRSTAGLFSLARRPVRSSVLPLSLASRAPRAAPCSPAARPSLRFSALTAAASPAWLNALPFLLSTRSLTPLLQPLLLHACFAVSTVLVLPLPWNAFAVRS